MNNKERFSAVMHYEKYDRLPIVHFGFWQETIDKWHEEKKLTDSEYHSCWEGIVCDNIISEKLGFDYNYQSMLGGVTGLMPAFKTQVLETTKDGFTKVLNPAGVIELHRGDAISIPCEIDRLFKDRDSFEKYYREKLQLSQSRIPVLSKELIAKIKGSENPIGIHCGSLFGEIRNWIGIEGIAYLYADDPELYEEVINMVGDISYNVTEGILKQTNAFSFGHFWEDICFKNGPLVIPSVFDELVGPHYKRITALLASYGIDLVSLDCDGMIDSLIPTWFNNGVTVMFPMEVGTWNASIKPWREKYGKDLRGVGGMNKNVFSRDYAAIDKEIERLRPLVELGGYIPCPDHRIAPDAIFENVQYYCERMKEIYRA